MIEFLSDYPSTVNLVICIIVGFCILLGIECVNALRVKSSPFFLVQVLGIIGLLISIAIPIGLCALNDEIHNYKQNRTCIYINHKVTGLGERDEFIK